MLSVVTVVVILIGTMALDVIEHRANNVDSKVLKGLDCGRHGLPGPGDNQHAVRHR